jgi:hypothetical protein
LLTSMISVAAAKLVISEACVRALEIAP